MVKIVNVAASGALDAEFDLRRLADDIGDSVAYYDPHKHPGMYLQFSESAPLITVYRTGKYIITGANSDKESRLLREQFLNFFSDINALEQPDDEWFSVQNYVCVEELGRKIDLSVLAIGLGLEKAEYEPEQFPGIIYRPVNLNCVFLIFGSGRVVITGCRTIQEAEQGFSELKLAIESIL